MKNSFAVGVLSILLVWVLFVRKPSLSKTLNATRWMLFSWGILVIVNRFTPISYFAYELTSDTISLCVTWIVLFAVGEWLGNRVIVKNTRAFDYAPSEYKKNAAVVNTLIGLSVSGLVVLIVQNLASLLPVMSDLSSIMHLRESRTIEASSSTVATFGVFLCCMGYAAAAMGICSDVLCNKSIKIKNFVALFCFLAPYAFAAGRQGFLIGGIGMVVLVIASFQVLKTPYAYLKQFIMVGLVVFSILASYNVVIVIYRTYGAANSMDTKIAYMNNLHNCELDMDFRDSLMPLGPVGDVIIEAFYYFSPNLYGLSFFLENAPAEPVYGAVQFPYVARRIESFTGINSTKEYSEVVERGFKSAGLVSNFFFTAVASVHADFGFLWGSVYTFLLGWISGIGRGVAVTRKFPLYIALQSFICAGGFFSIIYSPFAEIGFAFVMMTFMVLVVVVKYNIKTGYDKTIAGEPRFLKAIANTAS